jgi:hypothetical protein
MISIFCEIFANIRPKYLRFSQAAYLSTSPVSERPNVVDRSPHKTSAKHPKLRRRELLQSLLREKNPEKVSKLMQDLAKLGLAVSAKRTVSRWQVDEAQVSFFANLPFRPKSFSNHLFVPP